VTLVDAVPATRTPKSFPPAGFVRRWRLVMLAKPPDLLGYRYAVSAEILHGKKLGRLLGYPTANMALPAETALLPGIYAVRFPPSQWRSL
jgi:hypothetical protein